MSIKNILKAAVPGRAASRRGFTLVEVMITVAVVAIVTAGLFRVFNNMHRWWVSEGIQADMRQNARVALETITRDLDMAGYHTTNYGDTEKLNLTVTIADTDQIEVDQHFLDITTGTYTPRMIYYHLATDVTTGKQNLYRQLRSQPGLPTSDQLVAENIQSLTFTYYGETNNDLAGSLPAFYVPGVAPPAVLKDIKRIEVEVIADASRDALIGSMRNTMTLTANVMPRNLDVEETIGDTVPPNVPTDLNVIDSQSCTSKLQVKWTKNTELDLDGYVLFYGATKKINYPVQALGDPDNPSVFLSPGDLYITKLVDTVSAPNTYSIEVAAYDSSGNYSARSTAVTAHPSPDVTAFGGADDTTVNPAKASVPENIAISSAGENEVTITWDEPSDGSATVGYRVYKSESPFTNGANIPATYEIKDETDLPAGTTSFTDTGLIGCKVYYYAIASINCDETLVPTYVFNSSGTSDYGYVYGSASDVTAPPAPSLAGSTAGWQRAFINLRNPIVTESEDFERTEIYFNKAGTVPTLENGVVINGTLLPDSDTGTTGTFYNRGSQIIVFDSETDATPIEPELVNEATYNLLAVTYDLCGNTSQESTSVLLISLCGDDPAGPPPDNPISPTYFSCETDTVELGWDYPPKGWTGPSQVFDFAGYRVWRTGPDGATETLLTAGPTWIESWTDSLNLLAGGTYNYTVRAVDCVYENQNSLYPFNYSNPLDIGPIFPGTLRQFPGNPADEFDPANFVTTFSDSSEPFTYHNNVRFWVQNTSAGTQTIREMTLQWSNPNAVLHSITVGGSPSSTAEETISAGNALPGDPVTVNIQVTDYASGVNQPSVPVPVVFRFTNSDGSVNRFTDMRADTINIEAEFKNDSLQDFTCDLNTLDVEIPLGPVLGGFTQDQPGIFGIESYEVVGQTGTAKDNDIKVPGSTPVNVFGTVFDNSGEQFADTLNRGFDTLAVYTLDAAISTAPVPEMPTGTLTERPLQRLFGNNFAIYNTDTSAGDKMPVAEDRVSWYYVLAVDKTGNWDRMPLPDYGEYAFYTLPADPCNVTPEAPVLSGTTTSTQADLTWTKPALYTNGGNIPVSDTLTYDLYYKTTEAGAWVILASDIAGLAYTHVADLTTNAYYYAVKAKNSCSAGGIESAYSNTFRECEGTTGVFCTLFGVNPTLIDLGDGVSLSANSVCLHQGNAVTDTVTFRTIGSLETKDFVATEVGDTGSFSYSFTTTNSSPSGATEILATEGETLDIEFYTGDAVLRCTKSVAINSAAGPCDDTPRRPNPFSVSRSGHSSNATVQWGVPTFNTDGSPLTDLAGYQIQYRRRTGFASWTGWSTLATITNPAATSYNVSGLQSKGYRFRMRSFDSCSPTANYSNWTNTIRKGWRWW